MKKIFGVKKSSWLMSFMRIATVLYFIGTVFLIIHFDIVIKIVLCFAYAIVTFALLLGQLKIRNYHDKVEEAEDRYELAEAFQGN